MKKTLFISLFFCSLAAMESSNNPKDRDLRYEKYRSEAWNFLNKFKEKNI